MVTEFKDCLLNETRMKRNAKASRGFRTDFFLLTERFFHTDYFLSRHLKNKGKCAKFYLDTD
jgi:hypothetical protein